MYKGFLHTHYLVVTIFLLIYVVKTILLLSNKNDLLAVFTKKVRVFEMIISSLFLITGIYLTTQLPFGGKYDNLFFIKVAMVFISIPLAVVGFKRSNKILAALSLLLLTGSFGIAEAYSKRKAIPKEGVTAVNEHDGKALYENYCMACHGSDGKLGMSGAKDMSATTMDLAAIKDVILHGKGAMPAAQLSEEQANAVAQYVEGNIKGH